MDASARQRRELADFLRTRRERLTPADVGLPSTGRRRTPGLRREEIAMLTGISATWYTYLEQARKVRVSAQVLDALTRTLDLTEAERKHLYLLAHGNAPADRGGPAETLNPTVCHILDLLEPNPAYLTGARLDVLAWNAAAAELFTDLAELPEEHRNLVWWAFTAPAARDILVEWERQAQSLLARLRSATARHPDDPRFGRLVDDLHTHSPQVRDWWPRHDVRAGSTGTKSVRHPRLGTLTLNHAAFQVADNPEQQLVVYTIDPLATATSARPEPR